MGKDTFGTDRKKRDAGENSPPCPAKEPSDASECEERLRFETVLSDLSASFINLPADQLDAAIENAQRQICECLELDLSALWEWADVGSPFLTVTHLCGPPDGPSRPEGIDANEAFPWQFQALLRGETLTLSTEDMPPEAARDRESRRHFGIESSVVMPLSVGGGPLMGVLTFDTLRRKRFWPDEIVKRLSMVAEIFSNAICRRGAEEQLRESEIRLSLAADSADAGIWELNCRTNVFWATEKARTIFGYAPQDHISMQHFEDSIDPDDLALVQGAIESALREKESIDLEYRIHLPDGSVKWVASRGQPFFSPDGEPKRVLGISIDITERRMKEDSHRISEACVTSAIEIAGLGAFEMGKENRITFLDDRIRALFAVPTDEEPRARECWLSQIDPEDYPRVLEASRKVLEEGHEQVAMEYRYRHPARGTIWLHHLSRVLERDEAGRVSRLVGVVQDITERKFTEDSLRKTLEEVKRLRDQLQEENIHLREQVSGDGGQGAFFGESEAIQKMCARAGKVASTDSIVLITGETGVGKELLAMLIHNLSARSGKPMVKVNCAALPPTLIESELFGREKGAYTGAMTRQIGRFEAAEESTIFLDEIGDLPMELQVKLLRVLQDGQYERLGSPRTLTANVRVIAATNHDLGAMIREGKFREDLFHRLNVFPVEVPPLRGRVDDIPLLAWKFVQEFNTKMGKLVEAIPRQTMERLKKYEWPGNVRELRNLIERAMIVSEGRSLKMEFSDSGRAAPGTRPETLADVERAHIREVLERTRWRISGRGGAAEVLGLAPSTLHSRMKKLGISRLKS